MASVGLTLILSLGSILQPVQEFGLGARQVFHLMGYFLPITLTFVLPMAALFAGALVYGRFASDNEFDACRATGISVPTLVYPGLALAIMVAIANLLLSFYVMPVFVHRAEQSLKADAKHILFRNIQRRRYYALPPDEKYLIYADRADLASSMLSGVIVAQMKDSQHIGEIITAEAAKIEFDPQKKFNEVRIIAYKPRTMGAQVEGKADLLTPTFEFGSLLGDDIKFKKIDEMKSIKADLAKFYPIEKLARETYKQLLVELLEQDISNKINGPALIKDSALAPIENANNFYSLHGEPNSVEFTADQTTIRDDQIELFGNVVVVVHNNDSNGPALTLRCEKAGLILDDVIEPNLTMDLYGPQDVEQNVFGQRLFVGGLELPQTVKTTANKFKSKSGNVRPDKLAWQLPNLSGLPLSSMLSNRQSALQNEIESTLVDIKSEIHSRLVFGIGCVPMILIGIGLGIIKKGGHLLTAFGASCVPAAVLVVCIMSGKQVTGNPGASHTLSGVAIMWAGLGFLSFVVLVIYGRLMRN